MPDHDLETLLGWRGRTLVDRNHEKIGKIGDLYLDEETDRPAYAGVRTGLLGHRESIVPLDGIAEHDDELVADYDAELIRDAPAIEPDEALDNAEQARLARHYDAPAAPSAEVEVEDTESPRSGPEMIRSEEEVVTGTTEMRPAERVRLRKVLVTDHVKKTVPVRREEIRLETDPPREGTLERVQDPADDE